MNRLRNALLAGLGAAAVAAATPSSAATVLNVDWDASCGASHCFTDGRYTHTWAASGASGPITIGRLLLDRGILGDLDGQIFRLSFQLDGEEIGSWGSYLMAGIGGDELNFWGADFTWNPEDGDLVLVLEIVPPGGFGLGGFASNIFSAPESGGEPGDGERQGSLEGPQSPAAAVPEPGAWALMICGFGLAGATLRRRRALLRMQPAA